MDKIVLKSLSVENFASFADEIVFTTETDLSKKEHLENSFQEGDYAFNKVSFLYGANGSGKTFFCKIIREIQRLLKWSPLTAMSNPQQLTSGIFKGIDAPVETFAFDADFGKKPTCFMLEIMIDGVTYRYEFAIRGKEIIRESLSKKRRRREKLIERTSSSYQDIALYSDLKGFESIKHVVKPEALCLPMAAFLNNPLAIKLVAAIQRIDVVNMTAGTISPADSEEAFSKERVEKYVRILRGADPTLRNMEISFEQEEVSRQKIEGDDFENRELIATKTSVGVSVEHAVYKDGVETTQTPLQFFADESLGTVKLFTALPYLFDALESGGVLVIDEIENGLHLSLAREIIGLFSNEATNPKHAQLICTSHQPLLLMGDYRRDQVWVTAKDQYGKATLHRLSEKKTPRAKVNLTNQILDNAFGCNPDLFFRSST